MYIVITVRVVPLSGRQQLIWDNAQGIMRCYLKSAPEKNKANKELCKYLRKTLGVAAGDVAIISGETSRCKRVKIITNLSRDALLSRAGISVQQNLF